MCGIDFSNDLAKIYPIKKKIIDSTNYRGPDLSNYIIKEKLFFGFNYLSITGTHKGSPQPFERNGNILIFNGEIYNFNILKKNLKKKKIKFKTDGDTEVLSACLEYYGVKKTHELLEGMWAFVYYDIKKKIVTISRDRLGIKPLFYSKNKNNFFFSSSIEKIRKFFAKKNTQIDKKELIKFLLKGKIFQNHKTFYEDIKVFPAGNFCQIKNNVFTFTKYWKLEDDEKFSFSNFSKFKQILKKNISKHNNYDVKTALPLSSGLDSNYLLSNFKNKQNLICYTLKNFENDQESEWVKKKIYYKNVSHKFIDCKKITTKKKINNFIKNLDYPVRSFQPIYQFFIAEQAKKDKVKILLSGDGSDEIFGGYKYAVPYRVSSLISQNKISEAKKFCIDMEKFTKQTKKSLYFLGKKLSKKKMTLKKFLKKRMLYSHIPYWLYINDFVNMKNSIENRVPFLDTKLVDHVFKWKEEFFFRKGNNKFLLRESKFVKNSNSKFHKPGNYSFVYSILYKDIKNTLISNFYKKNKDLKKLSKIFKQDFINKNAKNADLWFRVYLFSKWKIYKKII